MGLFRTETRAVVLIDIGSSSVGGGFLYEKKGEPPTICYTTRIDVVQRNEEELTTAMLRALDAVCALLTNEGSAALYREAGHARIDLVLASVAAPWQETTVRGVSIHDEYSFAFTRAVMEHAVSETPIASGRTISDTSVISISLNGYETDQPWGRYTERADLTVLTSTVETAVLTAIKMSLRTSFHSNRIEVAAFAPVAYAVITALYPLQKDFVLIDVSNSATDALIVKNGIMAGVRSLPKGVNDLLLAGRGAARGIEGSTFIDQTRNASFGPRVVAAEAVWLADVRALLCEFSSEHPLPRTVFLLSDESTRGFLKNLLDTSSLKTLWLTDEPLSVIPLAPEHTAAAVRTRGVAEGDVFLSMLALFYSERLKKT